MKKKLIIIVAIIAALVAARWIIGIFNESMRGKMMGAMMTPKVALSEITEAEVLPTIEAPGRIASINTIELVPKVDGTLEGKYYKDGDFVKKGQLLLSLDPNKFIIAINKAKADLNSAIAQSRKADMDFSRAKELLEKDYISKATYDDTIAKRDVARAQIASARAALADANRLYGYSRIQAPVSGKIGAINVVPGNYVTMQGGAIATIVSMDPIYITYSLDSKQFNELRNDTILPTVKQNKPIKLEVTLPDGKLYEHSGVVDFYDNTISQSTGTIELRATIKNPDNILTPGDFVKVKAYSNTPVKKPIVPQGAVLQDPAGRYVFVLDEKGNAKINHIEVDGQYEKNWIIKSGLKTGDKIISRGLVKVMDGRPVRILTDEELAQFEKLGKSLDEVNENPEENQLKSEKPSLFSKIKKKIKNIIRKK